MNLLLIILTLLQSPSKTDVKLFLYNSETKTNLTTDIDSIVFHSKSRHLTFTKFVKTVDGNALFFKSIPDDTYDITLYRFYFRDKILKNVNINSSSSQFTLTLEIADRLQCSEPIFPGGRKAFFSFVKTNVNMSVLTTDKDYVSKVSNLCFDIDTLGNTTANIYGQKENTKNDIFLNEINRALKTAPKWTPPMIKTRKCWAAVCCSLLFTVDTTCEE